MPTIYYFVVGDHFFNVTKARRIVKKKKREVEELPIKAFEATIDRFVDMSKDNDNVVSTRIPIIAATLSGGRVFPIWGWKRIKKCLDRGWDSISAKILSVEETQSVLTIGEPEYIEKDAPVGRPRKDAK